jgi:hypothetical protein
MTTVIYVLAGASIVLSIGGLSAYFQTKHIGLLLSSIVSIGFSVLAIVLVQWWPLIAGFVINVTLRAGGMDPGARK